MSSEQENVSILIGLFICDSRLCQFRNYIVSAHLKCDYSTKSDGGRERQREPDEAFVSEWAAGTLCPLEDICNMLNADKWL